MCGTTWRKIPRCSTVRESGARWTSELRPACRGPCRARPRLCPPIPPPPPQVLLSTGLALLPGKCYSRLAWGPDNTIAAACGSMLHFLDARTGEVVERVDDAHEAAVSGSAALGRAALGARACKAALVACSWSGLLLLLSRPRAHSTVLPPCSPAPPPPLPSPSSPDHVPGMVVQPAARPQRPHRRAGHRRLRRPRAPVGGAAAAGVRQLAGAAATQQRRVAG